MYTLRLESRKTGSDCVVYKENGCIVIKCDGDTYRVPCTVFYTKLGITRRDVPVWV